LRTSGMLPSFVRWK